MPPDSHILSGFSLDDLDLSSVQQYRNRFSARFADHPWLQLETKDLLLKLGGWRWDRETSRDGLTVAGLLMFGKDEAIRDAEAIPQFHLDYQEKLSETPAMRWSDRIYPDGTWTANIFQFYQKVYSRLVADLPVPFQLGPDMYRKDETVVHEAVREALVNALVHADYGGIGGIRITREKHGIELRNPGTLLVTVEQLARGGVSECRNKSIQLMFQMIGAGEKAGSGVDKILTGWNSQQWLLPEVIPGFGPDQVTWRLPFVSLLPTDSIRRLSEVYGQDFDSLSVHERLALVIADVEGCVTNVRMQLVSDRHPAD
ncbi:MAG: transcriptional regulator, partial [Armatimonadota bacterium]|nr:transcriptional regulator [Armatimonadota bacterium]